MSRKGLSLAVDEGGYFHSEENKIELVHCPNDKKECVKQLPEINRYFQESHQGRMDKDYLKAIEALQHAFDITWDIQESACAECAELFRSTIVSSMKIIYSDLKDLTSGWFSNKKYKPAFEKATQVLEEMNQRMNEKRV
jgi:hypothetical protein